MTTLVESIHHPGGLVSWLIVGVVAGLLVGFLMKGAHGIIGDLVVGVFGAVIGGFLYGLFTAGTTGFWGSIVVAFLGACILIGVERAVSRARDRL